MQLIVAACRSRCWPAKRSSVRAVDYDVWFIHEVETGLAQIDAGKTLTHDVVGTRLAKKLAASATSSFLPANRE